MSNGQRSLRTILIIDDNEVVLQMARSTLESAGFRVYTRDRAAGSIAAIIHDRPDLVLLDVNMPNVSGESLAEILGRTRSIRETLIVLYSSLPAQALRMKALASGAHGFIEKSSGQNELVRQVRAFLDVAESSSAMRAAAAVTDDGQYASSSRLRAAAPVEDRSSGTPPTSGSFSVAPRAQPFVTSRPPRQSGVPGTPSAPPPRRDSGSLQLVLPTALFLDDDLSVLTGYRRALSSDEVIGEYMTSADQASRRLAAPTPPDVVVTDLVMPGMNGIELYRRALELDPTWRHRFVFVTGASSVAYVAEFLRRVGGRALEKPVDMCRLKDAIRYAATGARIFRRSSAEG
jgi:DNA-binding NarL/FixJ family response regulator